MYPLSGRRSAPTTDSAMWCPTTAAASAASKFRVDVSKNSSTAASAKDGEFVTSTTTPAPASAYRPDAPARPPGGRLPGLDHRPGPWVWFPRLVHRAARELPKARIAANRFDGWSVLSVAHYATTRQDGFTRLDGCDYPVQH